MLFRSLALAQEIVPHHESTLETPFAERVVLRVTTSDVRKKAFFSGTDDRDDLGNCYVSGVVGKISSTMEMVFRFNLPGSMKINSLPMAEIFVDTTPAFEVPKEWLGQVKRQVYVPPVNNYNYNKRNNYNAGGPVVPNENFRRSHTALVGMELSTDDMEVLQQFGHPFAFEEEGDNLPFSSRPLTQGRKNKNVHKMTRLGRKPNSRNVIS